MDGWPTGRQLGPGRDPAQSGFAREALQQRPMDEQSLQRILSQMVGEYGWDRARLYARLEQAWVECAGPLIARHSRIVAHDQNTLVIAVTSSVWAQELSYLKPQLLERINEALGRAGFLSDIRTRVAVSPPAPSVRERDSGAGERFYRAARRPPDHRHLHELFATVVSHYESAARDWMEADYHPCAACGSPTLVGYRLCAGCQYYREG